MGLLSSKYISTETYSSDYQSISDNISAYYRV